jgi:hypothetical protein
MREHFGPTSHGVGLVEHILAERRHVLERQSAEQHNTNRVNGTTASWKTKCLEVRVTNFGFALELDVASFERSSVRLFECKLLTFAKSVPNKGVGE